MKYEKKKKRKTGTEFEEKQSNVQRNTKSLKIKNKLECTMEVLSLSGGIYFTVTTNLHP
jgi:hypothetical protein